MKAAVAIKKAWELNQKIEKLTNPISEKVAEILDDDCAHIVYQAGDGMCVAYRGGMDNAAIEFMNDFDGLLKLNKEELLEELDRAGI